MPKNIIIVGSPRSGTSMTATIFTRLNYFVTDDESNDLQEANEFNPYGFWESAGLRDCNAEVFGEVGFNHVNTWLHEPITEEQAQAILTLKPVESHRKFVQTFESRQPWMWKDPNLCYTINYWWQLMDPNTTGVLFIRRNSMDICQSFVRLKWIENTKESKKEALRRIDHHMDFAEQTLKANGIPHLSIHYDDYAKKPDETARKISAYFEVEISAENIGYEKQLNTSKASYLVWINSISEMLPSGLRKFIKALIPEYFFRKIFPSRYINK